MKTKYLNRMIAKLVGCLSLLALSPTMACTQGNSAKLRVGDVVHVNVVGEVITGDYEIKPDGMFQMPYLDDPVPAAGQTTDALQKTLMGMLKPDYLLNPQIIVTLLNKKLHDCTVIGQVTKPRLIQFDPDTGLTLLQALGQAGDATPSGDLSRVEITRGGKTIPAPMPQSKNMRIVKGDTISVPALPLLGTYSLSGYVRKSGNFEIPRGKRLSLMWAIDNAGGIADTGSLKRVELRRDGRTREFDGEEELERETIRPGDLIKVDRRRF